MEHLGQLRALLCGSETVAVARALEASPRRLVKVRVRVGVGLGVRLGVGVGVRAGVREKLGLGLGLGLGLASPRSLQPRRQLSRPHLRLTW